MESVLRALILFGLPALVGLAFSPVGRAVGDRIRGRMAPPGPDPEILAELDRLREEVAELAERLDFAERLLADQRDAGRLPGGMGT